MSLIKDVLYNKACLAQTASTALLDMAGYHHRLAEAMTQLVGLTREFILLYSYTLVPQATHKVKQPEKIGYVKGGRYERERVKNSVYRDGRARVGSMTCECRRECPLH